LWKGETRAAPPEQVETEGKSREKTGGRFPGEKNILTKRGEKKKMFQTFCQISLYEGVLLWW